MQLKLDDNGHAVLADGKPVYVHEDGKELPFDALQTVATISRLNGEARTHREAKESAEAKLKAYEPIGDVAAALKALDTVRNLDAKKLVDAGEIERVKAEAVAAYEDRLKGIEAQIEPLKVERDSFRSALHAEKIGHAFAGSKFITEKLIIPHDMVQSMFGNRFKIDDDKIVALGADGKPMLSRAHPGNVAQFEEAVELIVEGYPHRDRILKSSGASGGGAHGGGGGGGGNTMTRANFDRMDPAEKMAFSKKGGKIVDN